MNGSCKVVERWLTSVVIDLNLCPFAQREYLADKVRFKESQADSEEALLRDMVVELSLLSRRPNIETTLLICPRVLQNFDQYNQFLAFADALIEQMNLVGVYQVASFHPDYQFAGTDPGDAENFTNRAPFPMLHLLRESSIERAIKKHPNSELIPQNNIRLMRKLGNTHMKSLLHACFDGAR